MIKLRSKIILIALTSVLILILLSLVSLTIYFNVTYPENRLRDFVSNFCKENLGKAVKFEGVSIKYSGNIIVKKFNLSISSDFNDNISFIQSEEAELDINFLNLFRNIVKVEGVHFGKSTISIQKTFGKDYVENFKSIFSFIDTLQKPGYINLDNFYVTFKKSDLFYHEFFKEHKLTLACRNAIIKLRSDEKKFTYFVEGILLPYKTEEIKEGDISISGKFYYDRAKESKTNIVIDNFDMSVFSEYIIENQLSKMLFTGGLSTDIVILMRADEYGVKGDVETNNLSITSSGAQQYSLVSNENFNAEVDMRFSRVKNFINFRELHLYDDVLDIDFSGKYSDFKEDRNLKFKVETNTIDLDDLSRCFSPYMDVSYKGSFNIKASVDYDLAKKQAREVNITSLLEGFSIIKSEKGKTRELLSNGSMNLALNQNTMDINSEFKINNSDFSIKSKTAVKDFYPPVSSTTVGVSSKKLSTELLYDVISLGLDKIFLNAYKDQQKGYDEIFFLQKPLGSLVNTNNFSLEWNADSLFLTGNAELKKMNCAIKLENGTLTMEDFNLEGYDAQYRLELQGYFNRDYPFLTIKGNVGQLDLGKMSRDLKSDFSMEGKLNIDFDYELTAYRLFQILQNSKGNVSINVGAGRIKNTETQKRITSFLKKNGLEANDLNDLEISNFSFALSQSGENFYVRNFTLNSNFVNFSAYGTYGYDTGLRIPSYVSLKDTTGKTISVPMEISGRLEKPDMLLKSISKEPLSLFPDIQ
ncbi:MAG: hypothetical protein CVV44_04550 [Spirochaetae bacterium HGW-Spirochaetae-1]|jgi:hypothetical protein|nr:MAG: hypothetical protein CVV44_04550 [Spirochaetae bacterium HGW-Spirochaetae-1]